MTFIEFKGVLYKISCFTLKILMIFYNFKSIYLLNVTTFELFKFKKFIVKRNISS